MLFGTAAHQYTARFAQPVQRKRWACALAQQALQAGAVMRCYANAGVYRKTAVTVSQHLFSIETFEQSKIAHLQTEDWSLVASDLTQ